MTLRPDGSALAQANWPVVSESVDAVVMVWALHEMARSKTILTEARRVLRPGEEVLVVDFPENSLASKLWGERYYCPDQVKSFLRHATFAEIKVRLIEHGPVIWVCSYQPPLAKMK